MKINELSRNEYRLYELDCSYQTKAFYDVVIKSRKSVIIDIKRRKMRKTQKSFKTRLFEDHIEAPQVFAVWHRKHIVGIIEGSKMSWNNLYRIWNLWVDPNHRRQGYGQALLSHMMTVAKELGCRAVVLEVQSCNDPAISFYLARGLHFVGLNTLEYTNDDIERKEVRLEMGFRL